MSVDFRHKGCYVPVLRWLPDDDGPREGDAPRARDWAYLRGDQVVPAEPAVAASTKCPDCRGAVVPRLDKLERV